MNRLRYSCHRVCLPDFSPQELLNLIKELLILDSRWIPSQMGSSLYVRPTCIANNEQLGVRTPDAAKLFVVASPVTGYFGAGFKAVKVYCEEDAIRAAPGGSGSYKVGANYGVTIKVTQKANQLGYDQVY
jgi:branched-chain amino acid aminotransferase